MLGGLVLFGGALVAVSALVLGAASLREAKPAWALFGFEVVTLLAGVMAVLFGVGKFRESPGLALACIAGTIFVAAGLGWYSVPPVQGVGRVVTGVPVTPFLAARCLIAVGMAAVGAWMVLSRERRAWKPAIIGAVLGAPVAAVVVGYGYPGTRGAVSGLLSNPIVAVPAVLLLGGLLAASAHLLIRAFEMGSGTVEK